MRPFLIALIGAVPISVSAFAHDDQTRVLEVRAALAEIPELANLNLGIEARQGTIRVWGSVPRAEVKTQISQILRDKPGIEKVINECHITPPPDPLVARVEELMKKANGANDEEFAPLVAIPAPGTRTHFSGDQPDVVPPPLPPPMMEVTSQPKPIKRPIATPVGRTTGITVKLSPPEPAHVPASGTDLLTQLEQARQRDPRFERMNIKLRNDVVYLSGWVPRERDIWDLAEDLADVPGVKRVVIKEIDSP